MRGILRIGILTLLVLGPSSDALACSQCLCGSPTPPGYLLVDGIERFNYAIEDRYLSKSNGLAGEPGDERQSEHRISGIVTWRPAPRVAFQGRVPYVIKTNVASPAGHTYRVRRPYDSPLSLDGGIPVLGEGCWRAGLARYDVRW